MFIEREAVLVHHQAIKNLAPADYIIIEKEHAQLEQFLIDLREACACCNLNSPPDCQSCIHEKQSSCQGRLPSFLFYVIDLVGKHFDHEETIMLSRPNVTEEYEYFRKHRQAHMEILKKLDTLAKECISLDKSGNTPEAYRQLNMQFSQMLDAHDSDFDDPFIHSTKT